MSEIKKFHRSSKDKIIAGVCGGLAEYFGIDPVLVRLLFVALTMLDGVGIILYIILAIIAPADDAPEAEPKENLRDLADSIKNKADEVKNNLKNNKNQTGSTEINRGRLIIGSIICFIGLMILVQNFIPFPMAIFVGKFFWPTIIIIIGLYFISKK